MLHYNITPEDKFLYIFFAHGNNMHNSCGLGPIPVQQHRQEKAGTLHSYSFHKGSQNIFN